MKFGEFETIILANFGEIELKILANFGEFLRNNAKVYFSYGEEYGKSFKKFIRINLATSLENVKEGLNRLLTGINKYLNK